MEQLIANILYSASMIFLVALSFSLIFAAARFFHFAHAAVITFGAYSCYLFYKWFALPTAFAVALAIIASTVLGWFLEIGIYRPMRRNGASSLVLLLASLGLYIVLQNTISMLAGDDTKLLTGSAVAQTFSVFGARITGIQLGAMAIAIIVFFAKIIFVDKTRVGLSLRAVADSPELAAVSGIELDRTMGFAFCLGSFLASTAGVALAFDVGMTPTMGLPMLLLGVVAVVLGGNGKIIGTAAASIILASLQQLAGWQFGTQWEEPAAFLLLLAFLMWRPQGLLGRVSRQASV